MAFIQFKNKGILVFLYGVLAIALAGICTYFVEVLVHPKKIGNYFGLCFAITMLLAALLIKRADEDYVVDDSGQVHYMNFDNRFMWMAMKMWVWIFYAISGFSFIAVLGDFLGL